MLSILDEHDFDGELFKSNVTEYMKLSAAGATELMDRYDVRFWSEE